MLQPTEQHVLSRRIEIEPHLLGCDTSKIVKDKAWKKVKNLCTTQIGFVMRIDDIIDINENNNEIDLDTGNIIYDVKFSVTTFRPKVGDTLITQVTDVGSDGFFSNIGPMTIYIPIKNIPRYYKFIYNENSDDGYFQGSDNNEVIKKGAWIKVKVCAIKKLNIENLKEENSENYNYIGGTLMAIGEVPNNEVDDESFDSNESLSSDHEDCT